MGRAGRRPGHVAAPASLGVTTEDTLLQRFFSVQVQTPHDQDSSVKFGGLEQISPIISKSFPFSTASKEYECGYIHGFF